MNKVAQLVLLLLMGATAIAQPGNDYLLMAKEAENTGNKETAKVFYLKAAALNNSNAHLALAERYSSTDSERNHYYIEAAKSGATEVTHDLLEKFFFRSNSLSATNPQLAYEIYTQAKMQHPEMTFFDDTAEVQVLKKCIEAGPFNAAEFIAKYNITHDDTDGNLYSIWEMATEASRGGRFGRANPHLVLQLVCQGNDVPGEKIEAVYTAYDNWKNNKIALFDPCDYTTGSTGLAYCAERHSTIAEKKYQETIRKLRRVLKNNAGRLLPGAYNAASRFVANKAHDEEGHDGTAYIATREGSIALQKKEFLMLVQKVNNGYTPKIDKDRNYNKDLSKVYAEEMQRLEQKPIIGGWFEIEPDRIKIIQDEWEKYRDISSKLLSTINPSITERQWKAYFTKIRIREIKAIERHRY